MGEGEASEVVEAGEEFGKEEDRVDVEVQEGDAAERGCGEGGDESGEAVRCEAGEGLEAEGDEWGDTHEGIVVEVINVEGGDGKVSEGGQALEDGDEYVVFEDGVGAGMEEERGEGCPGIVGLDEAGSLGHVHQAGGKLQLGPVCYFVVFIDYPYPLLQLVSGRKCMCESVEGVVIGGMEPNESLQIWTGHDH